jgi:hypothetical protein
VEELVKLHQQKAPIEVRYARGNTEGAVNLDDVYSKLDYEGKRYFELYIRYLWSKEQQGGEAADFLVKFSELGFKQRNAEEAKEDRVELLKFLEQAGIELSVFSQSTGEFPYEPEVTFPYDPGKDEVESLAFRLTQGYDIDTVFHELTAKEQNTGFPATLRLQDFFLITRDRTSTFLWRDLQSGKEGQRLIVEDLERHM